MRVLITGHLGYIGPVMINRVRAAGHVIIGLDTGYYDECIDLAERLTAPDGEIRRDIRDVRLEDFEGIDAVVHLAALSNDPLGQIDQELTSEINFRATVAAARLAKMASVKRFIFASSCSLYGAAQGAESPHNEESPFNPVSAYAVSKVRTERALRALADHEFSPVFLRNATAFGVSPRMRFDLVLNNLMASARTSGIARVLSDGTPWRPLVHIDDISLAALCAIEAPRNLIHNEAFNIGRRDCNFRIREIAETVAREVIGAEVMITGETAGDLRSYRVDFTKALNELPGFKPAWTLERGCTELSSWFDQHPNIDSKSIDTRHYIRLKQLSHLMKCNKISKQLFWQKRTAAREAIQ
jgi:nucleoside-diphosphate-sugar epimerase